MTKKITYMLLLITCLTTFSCSSEDTNPMAENCQLIDFTSDEPYEQQTLVIQVAANRLDKYVHYKNGQFELDYCTPEMVGLSETVFDYMQTLMKRQNEIVHEYEHLPLVDGNKFVYYGETSNIPRLLTRGEGPTGGVDNIVYQFTAYGIIQKIYISNSTLRAHSNCMDAATTVAAAYPETTITKYIASCCGLISELCDFLANRYPNGIIITYSYTVGTLDCVPYTITGQ